MIANGIAATSAMGGSSNLTLARIASGFLNNAAQFTDAWGTSGTVLVEYDIREYSDATLLTLVRSECGIAPLTLSTNVLGRGVTGNVISQTYTASGNVMSPSAGGSAPTALSFGSTAANILIYCTPLPGFSFPIPRFRNDTNTGTGTVADKIGWPSWHTEGINATALSLTASELYYFPYLVGQSRLYSQASVRCAAGAASAKARGGLYYDDGSGWAGALVVDFSTATGGTEFDLSSSGIKTSTLTNPIFIPAGWYWAAFQTNASVAGVTMTGPSNVLLNPGGTRGFANVHVAYAGNAYAALASASVASSGFTFDSTSTSGQMPMNLYLK